MKLYSLSRALTLAATIMLVQPAVADRWTHFLPLSEVEKMQYAPATQTYWFGTGNNGLWRYDGRQFEPIALPLKDEVTVTALALAPSNDTLWVGTHQGLFGYHISSKSWTPYIPDYITALFVDARGALWYGTKTGQLGKKDRQQWQRLAIPSPKAPQIYCIAQDREGRMYFGTGGAGVCILNSNFTWTCMDSLPAYRQAHVQAIALDRSGNKWLGTRKGVFLLDAMNQSIIRVPRPDLVALKQTDPALAVLRETIFAIWIDAMGGGAMKWFATSAGVSVLDSTNQRWQTLTTKDGLASNKVREIIGDNDGNLWFGLLELSGVSKLNNKWSALAAADTLDSDFVYAVEKDRRGRLWVGTKSGGIQVLERGVWKRPRVVLGDLCSEPPAAVSRCSDTPLVSEFLPDQTGMWVATIGCGIFKLSDSLKIILRLRENCPAGFPSNRVSAIALRNDTLWAGTDRGLVRVLLATRKAEVYLAETYISALAHDGLGRLWVGTANGLCLFKALQCDVSGLPGFVQNVAINTLARDQANQLWVGTNLGLARLAGANWTYFSTADGLPGEKVNALGVAPDGTVWCGTVNGAAAFLNQQWRPYTTDDGLSGNFIFDISFGPPNVVWFATWGGGVSRHLRTEVGPNTYLLETFDMVTKPSVTFRYAGYDLNTAAASLRYQYALLDTSRLQPAESEWSPVTPAPFVELQITSDGPRDFWVRAVDQDANVDATPARMRFYKIEPRQGGAITLVDSLGPKVKALWLYVPPNTVTNGSSIRAQAAAVDGREFSRQHPTLSFTGVAFALVPQPENETIDGSRPMTLTLFYGDSVVQQFPGGTLALYRRDPSNWTLVGGTHDVKRSALTTTITQLGVYALAADLRVVAQASPKARLESLSAQPRILSPQGGGFLEKATISFTLDQPTAVTMKIYNLAGRLVKVLCENQMMNAGRNALDWDGYDYHPQMCPSGMYLICLEAAGKTATKTVMVVNQ